MNPRLKYIVLIGLFSMISLSSIAQGMKDRFFHSLGYTAILDYFRLPSFSSNDFGENNVESLTGISFITYVYQPRINIINFSDNSSLDIHAIPALGFSYAKMNFSSGTYVGMISLPVLVGINFGNVSTYETKNNIGFGFAGGYEYLNGGLFNVDGEGGTQAKTSTMEPVVQLAIRFWSKSNSAKEIALFAGFGGKNDAELDFSSPSLPPVGTPHGSVHLRLTWSTYFNY